MHDYLGCIKRRRRKRRPAAEVPRRRGPGREHDRGLRLRPGLLPRRARLVRQALDLRGIAPHAAAGPLARRDQARQRQPATSSRTSTSPRPSSTRPACAVPAEMQGRSLRAAARRARRRPTGGRASTITTTSTPARTTSARTTASSPTATSWCTSTARRRLLGAVRPAEGPARDEERLRPARIQGAG